MGKIKVLTLLQKRRNFKNMFCSVCNQWMTECTISRHLCSDAHERRLNKQTKERVRYSKCAPKRSLTKKPVVIAAETVDTKTAPIETLPALIKTPTKCFDRYVIKDSEIIKAEINETIDCSPELFEFKSQTLNQGSLTEDYKSFLHEAPQNLLEIVDPNWDFREALWADEANNNLPASISPIEHVPCENAQDSFASDSDALDVISGTFQKCTDDHHNQMGYFACKICNKSGQNNIY